MTLALSTRARRRAPLAALLAALLGSMLLAAATAPAGAAGTLYRWSEPDGSLTYSPTPPADGTPYDTVNPAAPRPATADANGGMRVTTPAIVRAAPEPSSTAVAGTATPPVRVAPTPPLGAASVPDGATDRRGVLRDSSSSSTEGAPESDEKVRRCGELGKRVISLERRLATPLTAEAMDATVVQMARYQRSVERHCR